MIHVPWNAASGYPRGHVLLRIQDRMVPGQAWKPVAHRPGPGRGIAVDPVAPRRAVGVRWHEAFGAARYCTLVLRIMNRLEERGLLPPGSDLYLGGGVTDALRMQLEER